VCAAPGSAERSSMSLSSSLASWYWKNAVHTPGTAGAAARTQNVPYWMSVRCASAGQR
jgi:hypothetical protein